MRFLPGNQGMFTTKVERDICKLDFKRLPQYNIKSTGEEKKKLDKYEELLCSGPMWKRSRHGKGLIVDKYDIVDKNNPDLRVVASKYRNYAEGIEQDNSDGDYKKLDEFLHMKKKAPPRTKSWLERIPAIFSRKTPNLTQDQVSAAYDNSGANDLRSGGKRRRKTRRRKSRRR